MPGPLPKPAGTRRRTNAPTIPTTNLPASGRPGPVPALPSWVRLGKAGRAWWRWAWKTPQAAAWSTGDHVMIARRAGLEDDVDVLGGNDLRLEELIDDPEAAATVKALISTLRSLAGGKGGVQREARELDDRLGLTPKGRLAFRWEIVADVKPEPKEEPGKVAKRRILAVDESLIRRSS